MTYVCEDEFDREDPFHPGYSLVEVDIYVTVGTGAPARPNAIAPELRDVMGEDRWREGHPPFHITNNSHRLSLRKNLHTGRFEVYRTFARGSATHPGVVPETEVAFAGNLQTALLFAGDEWRRWHPGLLGPISDRPCEHVSGRAARRCARLGGAA